MDEAQLTTKTQRNQPLTIVHTGDGKGKTTAAMGIALRTWSQGVGSIGVFQFVKSGRWRTGEALAFADLSRVGTEVEWESVGAGWSWTRSQFTDDEKAQMALEGWRYVAHGLAAAKHRLWVLDEFTYPMAWGWVDVDEVVHTLQNRPGFQHVIITGRRCPEQILQIADLVTEMTKIKHPFDHGQRGQKGIEW